MDGLDIKQYVKNEPNMGRLKMVIPIHASASPYIHQPSDASWRQLAGVARCLCSMHDLGIVHGHLQSVCPPHILTSHNSRSPRTQANILVDKDGTARIAGLGNAYILPHSAARTMEGRAAKASDVHAFGVVAYEVWTGSFVRRSIRLLEAGFCGQGSSNSFDGEWANPIATQPPRGFGYRLANNHKLLAQRGHGDWGSGHSSPSGIKSHSNFWRLRTFLGYVECARV